MSMMICYHRRAVARFVFFGGFSCGILCLFLLKDELIQKLKGAGTEYGFQEHRHPSTKHRLPQLVTRQEYIHKAKSSSFQSYRGTTEPLKSNLEGKHPLVSGTFVSHVSSQILVKQEEHVVSKRNPAAKQSSISLTKRILPQLSVIPLSVSHSWSYVYGEKGCRKNPWRKDLLPLFKEWTEIAKKNGIEYVLTCGTLLGALRTGDVIPYDSDMDLLIDIEYYPKLKEIAAKRNFDVYDGRVRLVIQPEFELNISSDARKRYTCKGELTPSMVDACSFQDPMARLVRKSLHIDFYPFYTKGNLLEDTTEGQIITYKKNDMFPLRPCKFMGFDSFCPHNPWNILKEYYKTNDLKPIYICKHKLWVDKDGKTKM